MPKRFFSTYLIFSCLLLAACTSATKTANLDETLLQYAKYIRWSQFESSLGMHHPQYLLEHPVSSLDIERLNLFKVTGYAPSERNVSSEGNVIEQRVVIRMYNSTNAREISVVHDQVWMYDPELQRWLLHSGLPDVTSRR